jgi:hypothetical protein
MVGDRLHRAGRVGVVLRLVVTFAKLQELMTTGRSCCPAQRWPDDRRRRGGAWRSAGVLVGRSRCAGRAARRRGSRSAVLLVLPVGGADVPIVISLLNAFTGLTVAAGGFVLQNTLLLVAGTLVGASGTILTRLMAPAMGARSAGILFGALRGGSTAGPTAVTTGRCAPAARGRRDPAQLRAQGDRRPGYGLAVAQAQHTLRELAEVLEARASRCSTAIHPVAGRMPGHMNVLLAEANVPYEALKEMDEINPEFKTRRRAGRRRQRRGEPGGEDHSRRADLRDADPVRLRTPSRWCSSSARCGPGSPASTTSCCTNRRPRCCSATPRSPSPRCWARSRGCDAGGARVSLSRRSTPSNALAQQVGVAVVPRVLLDHVQVDPAQRDRMQLLVPRAWSSRRRRGRDRDAASARRLDLGAEGRTAPRRRWSATALSKSPSGSSGP